MSHIWMSHDTHMDRPVVEGLRQMDGSRHTHIPKKMSGTTESSHSYINESCHTWLTSQVTDVNESRITHDLHESCLIRDWRTKSLIYEWVVSHVAYIPNESCLIRDWNPKSLMWMSHETHMTYMPTWMSRVSFVTDVPSHLYKWVVPHVTYIPTHISLTHSLTHERLESVTCDTHSHSFIHLTHSLTHEWPVSVTCDTHSHDLTHSFTWLDSFTVTCDFTRMRLAARDLHTNTNEVMSHTWMNRVTRMDEARHTHGWITTHLLKYQRHRHGCWRADDTYENVMIHLKTSWYIWKRHGIRTNEYCHIYEVMSHWWMDGWIMTHTWMSHDSDISKALFLVLKGWWCTWKRRVTHMGWLQLVDSLKL